MGRVEVYRSPIPGRLTKLSPATTDSGAPPAVALCLYYRTDGAGASGSGLSESLWGPPGRRLCPERPEQFHPIPIGIGSAIFSFGLVLLFEIR